MSIKSTNCFKEITESPSPSLDRGKTSRPGAGTPEGNAPSPSLDRKKAPEQASGRQSVASGPAVASETEPGSLSNGLEGVPEDLGSLVGGPPVDSSGEVTGEEVTGPLLKDAILNAPLTRGWLKGVAGPLPVESIPETGLLPSLITDIAPERSYPPYSGSRQITFLTAEMASEPPQSMDQTASPPVEVQPRYLGHSPGALVQVSGIPKAHPASQGTGQEVDVLKTGQVETGKDEGFAVYLLGSGDGGGSQGRTPQLSGLTKQHWLLNPSTSDLQPINPTEGLKGYEAQLVEEVAREGSSTSGKKILSAGGIEAKDGQENLLLAFKPQVLASGSADTVGSSRVSNLEELMSRLVAMARWQGHPGHYELELKLKPETLGKLRVHAVLVEDRLSLHLMVETSEVGRALQAALPELKQGLQTYGLKLEQVHVQVSTGQPGGEGREGQEKGLRWGAPVGPLLEVKNEEDTLPVAPTRNYRLDYLA